MRRLIRIQTAYAVQIESPVGVTNSVQARKGNINVASIVELKNGDVEVRAWRHGNRIVHVVHREAIVDRVYDDDDALSTEAPAAKGAS